MFNLPARKTLFFGDKGITPASAGHIANLAKEYYQRQERMLQNMSLTNKSLRLLSGESAQISKAVSEEVFAQIPQLVDRIATAKALIAWLREAIKARESLMEIVQSEEYIQSIEVEEAQGCNKPESPVFVDNEGPHKLWDNDEPYYIFRDLWWWGPRRKRHIQCFLDEDEKIRYNFAAVVNDCVEEFIGIQGKFSQKVAEMESIKRRPLVYSIRDTAIYRGVCVSKELIAEVEYNIKRIADKYQYNGKAEQIRQQVLEWEEQQQKELTSATNAYYNQLNRINQAREIRAAEILQKVRNLRIIIPESLQAIYQEISALGKD